MSDQVFAYGVELVLDRRNKTDADEEAHQLIEAFKKMALTHGARVVERSSLWVAILKPGTDDPVYFVAASSGRLYAKIAGYCREWWDPEDGPMPDDEQELVEEYFATSDDEVIEIKEIEVAS